MTDRPATSHLVTIQAPPEPAPAPLPVTTPLDEPPRTPQATTRRPPR